MPRTKNMQKRGPPLEDKREDPPHTDTTQNTPDDEERAAAEHRPETRSTGMKLSIKLKQCPLPPPKDNEAAEPELEADAAQAPPPRPTTAAKTTREPTRAAPSSSTNTANTTKKKKPTATGGKKSKGVSEASSSRQTTTPPPNTTPPQRERVIQATTEEKQGKEVDLEGNQIEKTTPATTKAPETPALRVSTEISKEKAIPAVPLKKMKESDVLYLGWTRVDKLYMDVEKAVSPRSAAAPAMSDVTAPVPGELQVEANEVLVELQERQAKAAKNLILAIFEGNKLDRQVALEGLEEGFKEAGVSFWGRPVTFLSQNCYSVEVSTEKNQRALVLKQRVTRPTHELFFYKFPPGFSLSQKDLVHRPTMELDLIVEDLCETDNTPVFLVMMVEGFTQYLGKRVTREESRDQLIHVLYTGKAPIPNKIRIMGKVHPIHIQESRMTPPEAATPSKLMQDQEKRRRSPSAQGGTSRRQSDRASKRKEEALRAGQASPEMTRDQRSPSLERAQVERSPSEDQKYLALWSGPPVGYVTPTFHMARDQLPENGVHSFLEASKVIKDLKYRVEVDKATIVGNNMELYAALLTKSGVIPTRGGRDREFSWVERNRITTNMTDLSVLSWNVGGISKDGVLWNDKKARLRQYLRQLEGVIGKCDFFCFQEQRMQEHQTIFKFSQGIDDWILAGDFNFMDHEEDKRGGIIQDRCTRVECLAWNSFLLQIGTCDAYEIPGFVTHEPRFTWRERQHRGLQCRLDRFYLTMDLCMQGGKLDIDNTYTDFSDHHPIRLTLPFRRSRGPRSQLPYPRSSLRSKPTITGRTSNGRNTRGTYTPSPFKSLKRLEPRSRKIGEVSLTQSKRFGVS
ncbi:hypothetical protein SELMODRAFT_425108 [Selaginella moellendorffii]|uniref:Endonuclease/exonuclease/phosphatase domain-containing protein n=1 Tax=Selaginella moellendorffii TaxID=88036 RepID=D8SS16_SELML|nr:hypothetical protein SELMODRAFT_425108 [Selaginella moellendorffii]